MDKFRSLSPQRLVFDLAARLGSLEGYLYAREKVDKKYLFNWLRNIEAAYVCLPEAIRKEIQPDYLALLHKAHNLLRDACGHEDPDTMKIAAIISDTARWAESEGAGTSPPAAQN